MNRQLIYLMFAMLLLPFEAVKALPCDTTNMVVYNFLDRYLAEVQAWDNKEISLSQKMYDDKVMILDGSIANINKINNQCAFTLQRFDNKAYLATWQNPDGILLELAFPIQYELLLGITRKDLEQTLQKQITKAQPLTKTTKWEKDDLKTLDKGIYTQREQRFYYLNALNNGVYLVQQNNDFTYLFSEKEKVYSLHNMLQHDLRNATLEIHQSVYDFSFLDYQISLKQWLNYCRQENLSIYVGIEEETEEGYKVLVVAVSEDLGFNHTLSMFVQKDFITVNQLTIPTKINAFIPIHSVKNLYQQFDPNKKKKKW